MSSITLTTGGNVTASNVTASQIIQVPNAAGQVSTRSAYVSTSSNTPTTIISIATTPGGNNGISYFITSDISLGESTTGGGNTGSYQFQFKAKNLGGTLTISSIMDTTAILDGLLTGTSVSATASSQNILIQVIGLNSIIMHWLGYFVITQVSF